MATKKMVRKSDKIDTQKTVDVAVEEIAEEVEVKKEKKIFEQSEGVMCRSVTIGGLFVEGPKTGMIYRFIDYGDEYEVEYRDLVALVRSKSPYVYHPYFIIDDEDFIAEFPQIEKFYEDQYSVKDLKALLKKDVNEIASEIKKLPSGAVESLRTIATTQVANGEIDSISKIKALNELLGIELELSDNLTEF